MESTFNYLDDKYQIIREISKKYDYLIFDRGIFLGY